MKKILIATTNKHKIVEIRDILHAQGLLDLELVGLPADYEAPEEDGSTFAENATIKAKAAAIFSGLPSLADDSGLTVEALLGAPGIYSARYAGEGQDDAANRVKLLAALTETPKEKRQAAFVCAVALAIPEADGDLDLLLTEGACAGEIAFAETGSFGFGYDSLFYLPQHECTIAELLPEIKNSISHRYHAMADMAELIKLKRNH